MSHRILSLLPAATEIVYLLGLDQELVGVSGDSDYPLSVKKIPKIVSSEMPANLTSREIDEAVKKRKHHGQSFFHIDEVLLTELRPNVILTQELCSLCAISYTRVKKAAKILSEPYILLSLEPEYVEDIFENILTVAAYTDKQKKAEHNIHKLQNRITAVRNTLAGKRLQRKPSVLVIEWLDPLMVAGHWVPQMIELAGGRNLITKPGEKSVIIDWHDVLRLNPEYLIIAPCGFTIDRTRGETHLITGKKGFSSLTSRVALVDANAFLTRPGPRVIDGIEIFSEIFYSPLFRRMHDHRSWIVL